jgi:acyl-coenzyme A thioesterase PaaI-like protein
MDRWLGDGGMAIIAAVGGAFERYGVDGEDLGWVEGTFEPTQLACNPHGSVQAGVHSVLLDAAINFAINSALVGRDRTKATIEIKAELMRPALLGSTYALRGEVMCSVAKSPTARPRSPTPTARSFLARRLPS